MFYVYGDIVKEKYRDKRIGLYKFIVDAEICPRVVPYKELDIETPAALGMWMKITLRLTQYIDALFTSM